MSAADSHTFLQRTRDARTVMVLDLGMLGDSVHLLPALWRVRQSYPAAQLHVSVAAHVTSLFECVPWVDQVWGYPRYPKHATLRENAVMIRGLRREKFDALINLNGSDRSSWLSFFSGARERLGRRPRGGGPWFWDKLFTSYVQYPSQTEPLYLQRCRCLEQAGFPVAAPEFHPHVTPAHLAGTGIAPADAGTYLHLSPFTTAKRKELPPEQFIQLVAGLAELFPGRRLVLSCAPIDQERARLAELLPRLPVKPWRVFAGDLRIAQLTAVIQHSLLHASGDTGPLHLAVMTQTPSIAWFFNSPSISEWLPLGDRHRTILGTHSPDDGYIRDIDTNALLAAAKSVLAPGQTSDMLVS